MIIECTNCHSKYQYNEERFEGKTSKKIKCAKCATIFEIVNPNAAVPNAAPVAAPAAAAAPAASRTAAAVKGDSTFHSTPKKKEPEVPPMQAAAPVAPPKPAPGLQMPAGKRLSLAIIDGPDAGSVFRIEKPRVTIGRSGADLNINDTEASRQHAAVEVRDTNYTVSDLGSTNGTLVEGTKITGPTELTDKGEFQIGTSTIMLIVTEEL